MIQLSACCPPSARTPWQSTINRAAGTTLNFLRGKTVPTVQAYSAAQSPSPLTGFPSGQPNYQFRGGAATWFGMQFLGLVITILTLGICAPFAVVLVHRWHAKHTTLMGRPLKFVGSAWGIFGRWLVWLLLSVITLGSYTFWVYPRMTQWIVENTVLA